VWFISYKINKKNGSDEIYLFLLRLIYNS